MMAAGGAEYPGEEGEGAEERLGELAHEEQRKAVELHLLQQRVPVSVVAVRCMRYMALFAVR